MWRMAGSCRSRSTWRPKPYRREAYRTASVRYSPDTEAIRAALDRGEAVTEAGGRAVARYGERGNSIRIYCIQEPAAAIAVTFTRRKPFGNGAQNGCFGNVLEMDFRHFARIAANGCIFTVLGLSRNRLIIDWSRVQILPGPQQKAPELAFLPVPGLLYVLMRACPRCFRAPVYLISVAGLAAWKVSPVAP